MEKKSGLKKIIDAITKPFKSMASANPYFKQTMKRINQKSSLYGNINYRVKDGDFKQMSYISIYGNKGLIYGTAQEDYEFSGADVESLKWSGTIIKVGPRDNQIDASCCVIKFKDGKTAEADIYTLKLADFKSKLDI